MTHKDRFLSAILHEKPDQVPTYSFKVEPSFASAYEEKYGDCQDYDEKFQWVQFTQDQTILIALGIDATTDAGLGAQMNSKEFGWQFRKTEEGYRISPDGRIYKTASDGRNYYQDGAWTSLDIWKNEFPRRIPPPQSEFDRFEKKYKEKAIKENKIYFFPIIGGLHEANWLSLGYKTYAKELRKPTGLLEQTMDELLNVNLEICKRLLDIDPEMVIAFTDDIAQKSRLMVNPKYFEKYYVPRYKKLFGYIHKRGGFTMIHTDGKVDELIPYYIDMGLDMLQGLEPAAGVDLIELNEKYGDKISWNGNIDVSRLLPYGSPEDVRKQSEKIISAVAPCYNLAFGGCTDIFGIHPIENIESMYDTARAYNYETGDFDYER